MKNTSEILAALRRHHGGFDAATEDQCLALWAALDAATQQRYLSDVNKNDNRTFEKGHDHAPTP